MNINHILNKALIPYGDALMVARHYSVGRHGFTNLLRDHAESLRVVLPGYKSRARYRTRELVRLLEGRAA